MRVITGSARGRRLQTPKGIDTRPTSDMLKGAMMNIVQFELEGANVLDLFAGSGQLGIEALSRGARHCSFVDNRKDCRGLIQENLEHTGLRDKGRVYQSDAVVWLRTARGPFDIVFLDPPYGQGLLEKCLPRIAPLMHPAGAILCESGSGDTLPAVAGDFSLHREYKHGKSKIGLYRRTQEETAAEENRPEEASH